MIEGGRQRAPRSQTLRANLGFAPFPVWLAMRILGLIGAMMMIWWIFSLVSFGVFGTARPPYWVMVVGIWIGYSGRGYDVDLPFFCENLGSRLSSKFCPDCGQSVFDKMPATGFELEWARHSFWPSRICRGCGHDLSKSVATDLTSHGG